MGTSLPGPLRDSLIAILKMGILEIRARAFANDSRMCAVEADHVHNIPDLLGNFSVDALRYYFEVERPEYARSKDGKIAPAMTSAWDNVGAWLAEQPKTET